MIKKDGKRILASVLSAALAISLINYKVDVKEEWKENISIGFICDPCYFFN